MICSACRHENPDRAKFCLECGARLAAACPRCSTELPPGAKFCLECGHRMTPGEAAGAPAGSAPAAAAVPAAPDRGSRAASYTPEHLAEKILQTRSAIEGERRHVTVLFADVAGFTTLAEARDPEDVHQIIERCFELITAEVHPFEGTINQYPGDGVMALFGARIAHEDSPRRAAHAALGIQRALRDLSRELQAKGGPAIRMRIGLNTGPVVVGRIGDDLRMDYTAVGDTTNLAARMQQNARPGSVLVSQATQRAIGGFFETLDLGELEVHIPYIRALLSVDPGEAEVSAMGELGRRKKIFQAARMLTVRGAALRPLVLVFEDLQWVDTSTEEYLGALMDSLASAPIMLVLTHRMGYAPPFGSRSFHTALTLRALSEPEVAAMAGGVLGSKDLPEELRASLMAKAEGVPLFVEEVTRTPLDLGVLRRGDGRYVMTQRATEISVPDTIQGIIMARLDRLGEEGKRTVQLASVIGRLEELLGELRAGEIIYEQGLLPEASYVFKNAVIQDVAYQSLLVQRRKELHRAVGRAIEELYPDRLGERVEELASHFWQGEEWDKATLAYANQAALDYYARAGGGPADAVSARAGADPRHPPPAQPHLLARRPLRRGCGRGGADGGGCPGRRGPSGGGGGLGPAGLRAPDGAVLGPCPGGQALRRGGGGHRPRGGRSGDAGPEPQPPGLGGPDARRPARGRDEAHGGAPSGYHRRAQGGEGPDPHPARRPWLLARDFPAAIEVCRTAEAAAREIHDGFSELLAMAFRSVAHIGLGEHTDALTLITEGVAKARDRDNKFIAGRLTNTLGWLYQELGDFGRAVEHEREGADLGRRIKNDNVEVSSLINLGHDHPHLGEPERARALLEETLGRAEKGFGSHRWRWAMHVRANLAEALLALGRLDEAQRQMGQALDVAQATGSAKYVARVHLLRGEIALRAGQPTEADAALAEALRLARRIGYPTLTWQAAHARARALVSAGARGQGPDRIEQAWEMARLAADTIQSVADRLPNPALTTEFLGWRQVLEVQETVARLRRA